MQYLGSKALIQHLTKTFYKKVSYIIYHNLEVHIEIVYLH